jgi:hypothetical protein
MPIIIKHTHLQSKNLPKEIIDDPPPTNSNKPTLSALAVEIKKEGTV